MKTIVKGSLVVLILVILVFCAGCEGMGITITPEETPTPIPTRTPLPTTIPTPKITPTPVETEETPIEETPTIEITEEPTEVITPQPTPELKPNTTVSNIYIQYSDSDFSVDYPDNWKTKVSVIPTPDNPLMIRSRLKPDSRMVKFGNTNLVNFTVITSDFITEGNNPFDPSISNIGLGITNQFKDVSGQSTISNYQKKYTTQYQSPYVIYDVTIPKTSKSYPYSYTELDLASSTHFYTVRFNTEGNLEDYRDMKYQMFSSFFAKERG